MRAALTYTLLRLVLFAAVFAGLYLAGARSLLLLALAVLISGLLSYIALARLRDAMSAAISRRLGGFRARLDAGTRAEDED